MSVSLSTLCLYKKEIVKVKNLYFTRIEPLDSSCGITSFEKGIIEEFPKVLSVVKELKEHVSDVYSLYESIIIDIILSLKEESLDSFDSMYCFNVIDDLLNNINYQIKTEEVERNNAKSVHMKLYQEDYFINEDGFEFEIRFYLYDEEYGIDYVVFTDYQDREDEDRYFLATFVRLSNDNFLLFSVTPEEKKHYITDIALVDEIYEVLDYFDLYY